MNYKKYKWPIKIWGPVLEKQCQLEQQRGIEVVKKYSEKSPLGSMMQCYNNYKALLNVDLSKPLSPSTMKQIDEQLDFGQRESIPEKIFKRYEEMLQRPKTELASSSTESFNTQFLALEQSFKALSIGESSKSTSRGMTKTYDTISSNANALRLASSHMSVVDYNDYKNKRILVETQLADKIKNAKPDDPHFGLKIMTGFTTSEASDHLLVHIPNENDQKKPYELSSVYDRKKNTIEVKLQGGLSQKALVNMFNINKEFKPFELQPGNKPEKILEILKVAKDLGWSLDLDKNKSDLTLSADDISKLIEPQFKTQYEAILGIVPEKSQIENRTIGLS